MGLGHHYMCGYQDLSIQLIEQVEVKTLDFLAESDFFWQYQIQAFDRLKCMLLQKRPGRVKLSSAKACLMYD